ALESGINWIDTAEAYYECRNEMFIGRVLRQIDDELLVATKVSPSPGGTGFRRERCMRLVVPASTGSAATPSTSTSSTTQMTPACRSRKRGVDSRSWSTMGSCARSVS